MWFYQIVNNGQEENTFFSLQRKECGEKWMVFLGGGVCFFLLSGGDERHRGGPFVLDTIICVALSIFVK